MNDKDTEKLVFGMAHQVRNPCAIIRSNAELLLRNPDMSAEARQSLGAILNGVRYLESRLDEFVEFSKPIRMNLQPLSIEHLFQEIISIVKEKCQLQRVKISYNVEVGLSEVKLDHQQILLALLNIVLNAIESNPSGGSVRLEAKTNGAEAVMTVQDAGTGIHPRDLPEIFSPFYSTKEGGIGIGLAISKRIVDAHKGNIEALSQQGKGTVVTVRVPF